MASPATAYLDESGRPRLRESVTGFLDVLGFSNSVLSAAEEGQSQQCLDRVATALDDSRAAVRNSIPLPPNAESGGWAIKVFSDNLLIGNPCDQPGNTATATMFVLRCVQHYQLQMSLGGFFVRGGLTIGPLCVTDDIIFGKALIESYQLESKSAIVPRVVLTEPVFAAAMSHIRSDAGGSSQGDRELLCRDIDGWWFVNYLHAAVGPQGVDWKKVELHKASVMESLSRSARHDVLPKFGWVSRYHNIFCYWHRDDPGYSDQFRIKRVDEESAIERLSSSSLSSG